MNKLLLNESPLIVLPSLASAVGLNESIFIQQLHYWSQKSSTYYQNRKWVYKSVKEWEKEFPFWSGSTIKRSIGTLRKMKILLIKKLSNNKHDRVNYYAINYEKLNVFMVNTNQDVVQDKAIDRSTMNQDIVQTEPIEKFNMNQCIYSKNQKTTQEITTETTTESTHIFMHTWNEFAYKHSLNQISALSDKRKKQLNARLKSCAFKTLFDSALEQIEQSHYLLGSKGWKVTFDWLIQNDENILKVVEGNYQNKESKASYAHSSLNNLPKTEKYVVGEW